MAVLRRRRTKPVIMPRGSVPASRRSSSLLGRSPHSGPQDLTGMAAGVCREHLTRACSAACAIATRASRTAVAGIANRSGAVRHRKTAAGAADFRCRYHEQRPFPRYPPVGRRRAGSTDLGLGRIFGAWARHNRRWIVSSQAAPAHPVVRPTRPESRPDLHPGGPTPDPEWISGSSRGPPHDHGQITFSARCTGGGRAQEESSGQQMPRK
jgi:hypothetical protein